MKKPEIETDLILRGDSFLGFMAALGVLHLTSKQYPEVKLGWRSSHQAFLDGVGERELLRAVEEGLQIAEFCESRFKFASGKPLPWDLCGGGRAQFKSAIPEVIRDLRANFGKVSNALFETWAWADKGDPLGWAPTMREHALRAHAPTSDSTYRENAALWLAWEGTVVVGRVVERIPGWSRPAEPTKRWSNSGPWTFVWPIWSQPATLATVRSLLRAIPRKAGDMGIRERWATNHEVTAGKAKVLSCPRPLPFDRLSADQQLTGKP